MNIGFLDFETGGFSIEKNGLCEIGIIATNQNLEVIDTFQAYIKPYNRLNSNELVSYKEDSMAINGLSVDFLTAKGIDVTECAQKTQSFLKTHEIGLIVGHNVVFDYERLIYLTSRFLTTYQHYRTKCTMQMARDSKRFSNVNLPYLCKSLGIENNGAHTALGDCWATLELYKRFKR